jgi:hypothetical protein
MVEGRSNSMLEALCPVKHLNYMHLQLPASEALPPAYILRSGYRQ